MAPSGRGRTLVIACGALAHEILALIRLNGWDHIDLQCLPAIWHNHPERIEPGVRAAIDRARQTHDGVFVAYADCGTGGALARACADLGVEMLPGPHCYSFFEGTDAFAAHADEIDAFYLTDFLTRQFDAFVWRPLGLDRHPQLLDTYFAHYTRLIYLSQATPAPHVEAARAIAARLGLAFEHRPTGYGDLATGLAART